MKSAFPLRMPQRWSVALLLLTLVPHLALVASAQPAQFRPAQLLYAGLPPLAPGSYAIPCVADWNGDGRKDLIVGYRYADKVALYLNAGSDASPVFTNYVNLQAGGADIYIPGSGCGAPAPFVCDYDGDGRRDLLVGDGASGYVYFYRNTNTDAAPILAPGVALMVGVNPLSVTLSGDSLRLRLGWRRAEGPALRQWRRLRFLLQEHRDRTSAGLCCRHPHPSGRRGPVPGDSLSGPRLRLGWGWRKGPCGQLGQWRVLVPEHRQRFVASLQAPVALCAPTSGSGLVPINIGPRMRLDLVDWNNDGTIDLLIGNASGTVSYYEGYRFGFTRIAGLPPGQHVCEWNSASYLTYQVLAGSLGQFDHKPGGDEPGVRRDDDAVDELDHGRSAVLPAPNRPIRELVAGSGVRGESLKAALPRGRSGQSGDFGSV